MTNTTNTDTARRERRARYAAAMDAVTGGICPTNLIDAVIAVADTEIAAERIHMQDLLRGENERADNAIRREGQADAEVEQLRERVRKAERRAEVFTETAQLADENAEAYRARAEHAEKHRAEAEAENERLRAEVARLTAAAGVGATADDAVAQIEAYLGHPEPATLPEALEAHVAVLLERRRSLEELARAWGEVEARSIQRIARLQHSAGQPSEATR